MYLANILLERIAFWSVVHLCIFISKQFFKWNIQSLARYPTMNDIGIGGWIYWLANNSEYNRITFKIERKRKVPFFLLIFYKRSLGQQFCRPRWSVHQFECDPWNCGNAPSITSTTPPLVALRGKWKYRLLKYFANHLIWKYSRRK